MKIIVAGYPKTGTKSMVAALNMLGFTVYDYMENYEILGKDWMKIMEKGGNVEDFKKMYQDVDACTDMPCCFFWQEILQAFPDAKIILTVRDDEQTWLESFKRQMSSVRSPLFLISKYTSLTSRDLTNYGATVYRTLFKSESVFTNYFSDKIINDQLCTKSYRMHNSYVQQTAPSNQLLVYNVKQGWGPLCTFLNVPPPPPDKEFPRKNIKAKIMQELQIHPVFKKIQTEFMIIALAVTLFFVYSGSRFFV